MFGLTLGRLGVVGGLKKKFSPMRLFAASEVGAWYDPSDLSTMFQDSAGTTPVTADGQPVGLILDKSKGLALGPNLITDPLNGAASGGWSIDSSGVHRNGASSGNAVVSITPVSVAGYYKITFDVANFSGDSFSINIPGGNIGAISSNGSFTRYGYVISGATFSVIPWGGTVGQADISNIKYQLIAGNHASQATTAARPLYKTDGTYHWLKFDGVDDTLSTAAIDLTGTDKISVFAGVRKTSGTPAYQSIVENTTLQGSFSVFGPGDSDNYYFTLGGTTRASLKTQSFVSPHLAVISLNFDISGATRATEIFPRVNSAIPTLTGADATDAGTGNFGNNILYLGSRNGSSLYNAGNIYSLIVRSALSTTQEITNTETWVNQRTGAY